VAKPVRKQSNTRFVGALVAIAVIGVGILGYTLSRPSAGIKPVDPNLPPGTAEGYLLGNPDAPLQVIEFVDFECPICAVWSQVTGPDVKSRLIATGQISMRIFDFPLDMHPNSWPASNAVACAADQGKFEAMSDQVFGLQDQWSSATGHRDPRPGLEKAAKATGVDMTAWTTCFESQKHYPRIKANLNEGVRRSVGGTPTFVIGSKMVTQQLPFDAFKKMVDEAIAEKSAKAPAKGGA
jgi:protein-disulfide isomerase